MNTENVNVFIVEKFSSIRILLQTIYNKRYEQIIDNNVKNSIWLDGLVAFDFFRKDAILSPAMKIFRIHSTLWHKSNS